MAGEGIRAVLHDEDMPRVAREALLVGKHAAEVSGVVVLPQVVGESGSTVAGGQRFGEQRPVIADSVGLRRRRSTDDVHMQALHAG